MKVSKKIISILSAIILSTGMLVGCKSEEVVSQVKSESIEKVQESENKATTNEQIKQEEKVQDKNAQTQTNQKESIQKAQLHFINTGNSDAILIKQGEHAALIDGGDNDDENLVVSYLQNQGVKKLDYIFATHPHADHIGGLDAVVNSIPTEKIYVSNGDAKSKTYADFIQAMANKNLNPSVPLLNSEFNLGSSKFKVLSVANENDPNNNSIVLLYTNGNDKVLLMGDAEAEIEGRINTVDVDLLKVGHHGSHSSSTPSFIDKVNPEYAVITAGKNNKYNHPHKETMELLKSKNIEVHRSDECGDIIFTSTGNGLALNCKKGSYNYENSKQKNKINKDEKPLVKENMDIVETKNVDKTEVEDNISSENNLGGGVVYWTPKGKSYHSSKNCQTLSRSKVINSGTIEQSGKFDPCDKCN